MNTYSWLYVVSSWRDYKSRIYISDHPMILQFCKNRGLNSTAGWTSSLENDNTPHPLDQWTINPFIRQQTGNCKSFTLTQYLADLFAMHRGPRSILLCTQHHIQLTSLSFQVDRPSHSWDTAISIFYLENPSSMSWVRSKLEATMWV